MENSVDPDKTAPIEALCSGSTPFASILNSSLILGNDLQQMTSADDIFRCTFFLVLLGLNITASLYNKLPRPGNPTIYKHGYLRSFRMTSSCLKMTRLP